MIQMTDGARERMIAELAWLIAGQGTEEQKRSWIAQQSALINARSAEQVARLELERGLN